MFRIVALAFGLLFLGCQPTSTNSIQPVDIRGVDPEDATRKLFTLFAESPFGAFTDEELFYTLNGDEILSTLEIVDVDTLDSRAAVFIRYSIGAEVFRDVIWTREVESQWIRTHSGIYSAYGESPQSPKKVLFEKVEAWEENSASKWREIE